MHRADLATQRLIAPSILSADYSRLGAQIQEVTDAGASVIHVDVMDGHFVPPITVGPLIVDAVAADLHGAGVVVDVHLMIERPERHVADFAAAGADVITIHAEATPHVDYALNAVREAGCLAGLALNPATPLDHLESALGSFDLALCMSVNPGWGGQKFIQKSPERLRRFRSLVAESTAIEVDGGVEVHTAPMCAEAGANLFVAGSAVFGTDDPAAAYRELATAAGAS